MRSLRAVRMVLVGASGLCVLGLSVAASAAAVQATTPVVIKDAWIREAAVAQASTAAYATIENRSDAPVRLLGAVIDGVGVIELHEMRMTGDMMAMVRVASIAIPARSAVELKPGGLHLMLFQLARAFVPGETVTITCRFADGTSAAVGADVRKKSAMGK